MKAIYPCSFDPILKGHVEVIIEASNNYEYVFLLVANSENKEYQNTLSIRAELVEKVVSSLNLDNVEVIKQEPGTLTPNIAKELGVETIVRGVASRNIDKYEEDLAESYLEVNDDLIINYIVTPTLKVTSQEVIKLNQQGKSIKEFIPREIEKDVILKWQ